MPYFSIIMPTHNREDTIGQSIQSLIDQTFSDFELIIVDDHGNDDTKKIIENFSDNRFRYFYLDENKGPAGARDFGIKKVKGNIIALADSDDINYPDRLKLTHETFKKNSEIDVVYGRSDRLDPNGVVTPRPTSKFNIQLLKYYNFISNPTTAFKKETYLKTSGYDSKIRTSEDYDLWLSFLDKDAEFMLINKSLVLQKIHQSSITSDTEIEKRKDNLVYVRKKHNLAIPDFEAVKKLVENQELLDFISTPDAIDFWFK